MMPFSGAVVDPSTGFVRIVPRSLAIAPIIGYNGLLVDALGRVVVAG